MYENPEIKINLHYVMREKGFRTIQQLSEETGLSRKAISQALNKKHHRMHTDTIARLCKALDCEVGDLLILIK